MQLGGAVTAAGELPTTDIAHCDDRADGGGSGGGIVVAADKILGANPGVLDARGGNGGEALGEVNSQT